MAKFDFASRTRVLFILFFVAIGVLFPLHRASAKKLMIVAAHPDDEALMAAGVIRTAILNGDQVNVVIMTNGDSGGVNVGYTRMQETVNAMGVLGVNENNVIFLGYPDGLLDQLYRSPTIQYSSAASSVTYANRGLGRVDYHYYAFGVHGAYTGQTVLQDLQSLFQNLAPDEIYTHNFYDAHRDHKHTDLFIIRALIALKSQGSSYAPILYENIVHDQNTATCSTTWPPYSDPSQVFPPPTCLFTSSPTPPYRWSDIVSFNVPLEMQNPNPALNLKSLAFGQYLSQANAVPWGAYVKKNEWFWLHDIGHNLAPLAQVTVSSETGTSQYGVNAVDGIIAGDPYDLTKEWRAGTLNVGEWIKLTWAIPQTVSQIMLYDRPNLSDNILAGTLSFSDGSTIAVGALPTNGASQIVTFAPKTVSWVMFTIDSKAGYYTGLAEFEVYGTSTAQTQDRAPQITSGPTAQPSTIYSTQSSQLSVVATDADGDVLTYSWSTTGGTITPNGPAHALFVPPATNTPGVYTITVTVSDSRGGTVSGSTTVTVNPITTGNLAQFAMVQVSSENVNLGQLGIKAVDGVVDGYPGDSTKEWATVGQKAGAWIQLNWAAAQSLEKVVLYDRPNLNDNVLSGTLTFSDGSSVPVGALPANGAGLTVLFSARTVNWVRFTVNSANGNNIGLAEFQVFGNSNVIVVPSFTLTVASSNPASGASITVSPNDNNNQGNGITQFTRTYNSNTAATLTAAATAGGNNFGSWSGCDSASGTTCNVTMNANKTVTASYGVVAPAISLSFEGQIRDRVGQNNLARTPDGQSDGTFTVMYTAGGNRTVTQLRLTNNVGGVWDTIGSTGFWTLGAATGIDTALLNGSNDSVSFTVNTGDSFKIFGADFNNTEFLIGRTFALTANFADGSSATTNVTIASITLPTVTIVSTTSTAIEGGAPGAFTVTRTGGTTGSLTVNYTVGGTATNGVDYTSLSGSVVIPVGATSAVITVAAIDDNIVEGNETVIVTLSATAAYTVGSPNSATMTIQDHVLNPTLFMTYDGQLRDRVGQGETRLSADGQMDGVFTVTLNVGSGNRTVTRLQLTNSAGGVWNTQSPDGFWSLGVATGLDNVLLNAANDSVNFSVLDGGTFKIFASDYQSRMFVGGTVFTLTANFADGSTATAVAKTPSSPPTISLSYDGLLRDRVGQAEFALVPDGRPDGVFTVTINSGSGNRTVTRMQLNRAGPIGVWNTQGGDGFWSLGAATALDAPLLNAANDAVNFGATEGTSFKIFAADSQGQMFVSGSSFTLSVNFADGSSASGNVTIN